MLTSSSLSKLSCDCDFVLVLLRFLKFEIGVVKTSSSLWPVVVLLEPTAFDLVRFTNTGASSVMAEVQVCDNSLLVHFIHGGKRLLPYTWTVNMTRTYAGSETPGCIFI